MGWVIRRAVLAALVFTPDRFGPFDLRKWPILLLP